MRFLKKLKSLLQYNIFIYVCFIITLIYVLICTLFIKYESNYNIKETKFYAYIIDYKIDGDKLNLNLSAKEKLIANYYFKNKNEKSEFLKTYSIGDKIYLNGTLKRPVNNTIPNTFNYKKHLYGKKIFYILNIEKFSLIEKNKNILYSIKNYFFKRIESIDNNEYIYAFILGEDNYIESSITEKYKTLGVTHLFSLSGLNVMIFALFCKNLLKVFKISESKKYIITFLILFIMCFITGFSVSILRATLLFFLISLNKIYNLKIKTLNLVLISGIILLIANPFYMYDLAFLLSFSITYFIVLNSGWYSKKYIINLLEVSFISFISSLPIIAFNFYNINLFSVINNLFFIPYVNYIVYPLSLIIFLFPGLHKLFAFSISIMETVTIYLSKINFLVFTIPKMSLLLISLYYIMIFLFSYKKKIIYVIVMIVILIINSLAAKLDSKTYFYFCDVGQGDSVFIITENNMSILIDTGGIIEFNRNEFNQRNNRFSLMKNTLIPFYMSKGIKKIDYLFLTHGDADHMGYSFDLIDNFKVYKIFVNNNSVNSLELKLNKYEKINKKYIEIDNLKLYFLNDEISKDENDSSMVILIKVDNYKFLMMGDASKKIEEKIIKDYDLSNIDVLKVGHHGSKTSTSETFIKNITPKYSIISVKKENNFNHPSVEVINILNKYNSKIYQTSLNGSLEFIIDKGLYIKEYNP